MLNVVTQLILVYFMKINSCFKVFDELYNILLNDTQLPNYARLTRFFFIALHIFLCTNTF